MLKKSSNKKTSYAFSLVELSAVIVIISLFIAAILGANALIAKFHLNSAKTLTLSSPIASFSSNILWLETSLDNSIASNEAVSDSPITVWNDQKVSSTDKISVVAVGDGPVYSNTINRIHAVKFSGSSSNYLQISDASFLNGTDYTIVVLEKRQSNSSDNYFFGDSPNGTADQNLALGYSLNGQVIHAQGSNSYTAAVSSYENSTDKPRIFVFTHSATDGKKIYINGILAAEDTDNTTHLSGITSLAIGKSYTGEIGEVAIFTKALGRTNAELIEKYLSKKWSRPLPNVAVSCASGTVTESGCSLDCDTSSFAGISTPSAISDGATVSATCGQTGYDGETTSLTCSSGSISGNACACASGYSASGSSCIAQCSVNVEGVTTTMTAIEGDEATATCDDTNYTGTATFTCTSGSPDYSSTCSCSEGYEGSGCSSAVTCTAASGSGYSAQSSLAYAASGSGSFSCDSGYEGSINYTCTTAGVATITGGACTPITCSISGVTGFNNQSGLAYAATDTAIDSACTSGYSGSPTYTCTESGAATITGECAIETCTGGTLDDETVEGEFIHTFSASSTFTCPADKAAQILVVAGGGGGSKHSSRGAGGGGGGGVIYVSSVNLAAGTTYTVTVGSGGFGKTGTNCGTGSVGANSVFSGGSITITATGGGKGGGCGSDAGSTGGSGGGGDSNNAAAGGSGTGGSASGVSAIISGNAGAAGYVYATATTPGGGGGGGGAGSTGYVGNDVVGGNGGSGISYSISGASVVYGAGGGGAGYSTGGTGGSGAGNGSYYSAPDRTGLDAVSGKGGGGGGSFSLNSGNGGSGVVIIRY